MFVAKLAAVCYSTRSAPERLESVECLSIATIDSALGELRVAFEDEAQVSMFKKYLRNEVTRERFVLGCAMTPRSVA